MQSKWICFYLYFGVPLSKNHLDKDIIINQIILFSNYCFLIAGFVHGDINNCNIIVKKNGTSDYVISGLIDFGDACFSFCLSELVIVMADLMTSCYMSHNPFAVASALQKGYTNERARYCEFDPLTPTKITKRRYLLDHSRKYAPVYQCFTLGTFTNLVCHVWWAYQYLALWATNRN